jgi:hypothetical protein
MLTLSTCLVFKICDRVNALKNSIYQSEFTCQAQVGRKRLNLWLKRGVMPRAEGVKYLPITLADEAQEQVKSVAAAAGYKSAADYVRDLIKRDMSERGIPFDDGITKWGHGRSKKKTE